jgi:hypothetical protein
MKYKLNVNNKSLQKLWSVDVTSYFWETEDKLNMGSNL